jgi:hypothetical protein
LSAEALLALGCDPLPFVDVPSSLPESFSFVSGKAGCFRSCKDCFDLLSAEAEEELLLESSSFLADIAGFSSAFGGDVSHGSLATFGALFSPVSLLSSLESSFFAAGLSQGFGDTGAAAAAGLSHGFGDAGAGAVVGFSSVFGADVSQGSLATFGAFFSCEDEKLSLLSSLESSFFEAGLSHGFGETGAAAALGLFHGIGDAGAAAAAGLSHGFGETGAAAAGLSHGFGDTGAAVAAAGLSHGFGETGAAAAAGLSHGFGDTGAAGFEDVSHGSFATGGGDVDVDPVSESLSERYPIFC